MEEIISTKSASPCLYARIVQKICTLSFVVVFTALYSSSFAWSDFHFNSTEKSFHSFSINDWPFLTSMVVADEICGNGIDDDGDLLVDCDDPDCYLVENASSDVPKSISASAAVTITSTLTISESGTIEDINVKNLDISHTWIDDVIVSLTSPSNTTRIILSQPCNWEDNILMSLDDEAATGSFPCPPVNGLAYQPTNTLSVFDGEEMNGTWTLTIQDVYPTLDGGSLNGWTLEITKECTSSSSEICDNGVDDDGDNLVDNFDPDCPCSGYSFPNINFDYDVNGNSIANGADPSETWASWGVHITTNDPTNNPPRIFDSANPESWDLDLGSPNEDFGGQGIGSGGGSGEIGENSSSLYNVVIINSDSSNSPSDNASGGSLLFNFDTPRSVSSIEVLDFDHGLIDGYVKAYDASNNLIKQIPIYAFGNNSYQKLVIDANNVSQLEVEANNSFSVATLFFCDNDLPTASIGDYVWNDANGDGLQSGESGFENIEVSLYNNSNDLFASTLTDNLGYYSFDNLPSGSYEVQIAIPSGYSITSDLDGNNNNSSGVFILNEGQGKTDVDFGLNESTNVEICGNGIDDDGDTLVDCDDPDCYLNYVIAAEGDVRNGAATNAMGAPDNITTEVGADFDYLVVTLEEELPVGTDYTIYISGRGGSATTDVWEAPIGTSLPSDQEDNPVGFTFNGQATGAAEVITQVVKTTSVATKYIYFDRGSGDIEIDAVTYAEPCYTDEICGNGIDDDGDTLVDCDDPDCYLNYVIAAEGDVRNGAATNAMGAPDNITTEVGANFEYLVVTLEEELPVGTDYTIYISGRGGSATTDVWEAPIGTSLPSDQEDNPVGFTFNGQATGAAEVITQVVKTTSVATKYIYFDRGSGDIEIDAVTYAEPCYTDEICGNGIDDDGDGSIDENDPNCYSCSDGVLNNSDFENGLMNWDDYGNTSVTVDVDGNNYATISGGEGGFGQIFPITPEDVVTLTFFAKKSGIVSFNAGISFSDAALNIIGSEITASVNTDVFQEYTVSFAAPANAAYVKGFAYKDDVAGTGDLDGFCLTIESNNPCVSSIDYQGFQILTEGDFVFDGSTHVHGPLGIGGNLNINTTSPPDINMDNEGTYVFPGDGTTTTGLLVNGGIVWSNGFAKVLNGKYIHIGNSSGSTSGDNGNNSMTRVYPVGTSYDNSKRIEGTIDQTPSPAVFQSGGFDISSYFNEYRSISESISTSTNTVQLKDASGNDIAGNNVTTPQNVKITSLNNGLNFLNLSTASLNNFSEFKFEGTTGMPNASRILVINVEISSDFSWNNVNMPGLSGAQNGAYILWNFHGNSTYDITINYNSLIIGTIFTPNQNFIKNGTGDIDGNIVAKTVEIGSGEVHFYPFNGEISPCYPEEICDNGLDDDGDGFVDCLDGDCGGNSTCVECNVLENTEFNLETNNWVLENNSTATSTMSIDNTSELSGVNSAFIDITSSTGTEWHTQLRYNNIAVDVSKTYNISFEAKATASKVINVAIQQDESPYTSYYYSSDITITTTPQTYTLPNISVSDTDIGASLKFYLGKDANDFWLDNVILEEVGCATFEGFDNEVCYFVSDGAGNGSDVPDSFYTFNYITSEVVNVGPTGTNSIESMAMDTVTEIIYAANYGIIGTINPSTGSFSILASSVGNVDGAEGQLSISDIDGMTFDNTNSVIWATERRDNYDNSNGAPDDLLFQINPITGLAVQNAFGAGIDYLVINTSENDLDDIAMGEDGTLYGISNYGSSGNQSFGTINTTTGQWTAIGDYGIRDVESLAFTASGQMVATTGKDGVDKNKLYTIDAGTGVASFVGSILPGEDVEACDCLSANLINLQIGDKVWADIDGDGIQDIEEPGISGVVVNLLTSGGSAYMDGGSPVTTTTDNFGSYIFDNLPEGQYRVEFVLPGGASFSPQNAGGDNEKDSNANTSDGRTSIVTLSNSTNNLSIDAGLLNTNPVIRNCDNVGELFVADNNGNIIRYDYNTGAFIDNFIQGLNGPIEMVVGSDDWLYVSNSNENSIRKYSLLTGVLIETFTDKIDDPHGLTIGPDGNIYINNDDRDEVLKLDISTGVTSVFVSSGSGGLDGNKWGIEFGPDGNLYVTSFYTDEVIRYNGTTGAFMDIFVTANDSNCNAPSDLTFGPDGNLYVTGQYNDKVAKYNGSTGAYIEGFVPYQSGGLQDPVHLTFLGDGNVYVSSQSSQIGVLKYDGSTGSFIENLAAAPGPNGLLFAPVPNCPDACYQPLSLSNVTVSNCINQPLRDVATVTVEVSWNFAPSNDIIEVTLGDRIQEIDVINGATSPYLMTFNVIADGSTDNVVSAIWKNGNYCGDTELFDIPAPCSSEEIGCDILYLCGLDKPYDGDAWDHGWIEYLDAVNGDNTILPILTKNEAGLGTYDVMNQNTFVNVDFSAYEIIIVSGTTEGHISSDLVDSLKNMSNSILVSNYNLVDDFGLSSSTGTVFWNTSAYTDPATFEQIYTYNNPTAWGSNLFTKGDFSSDAIASLWASSAGVTNETDGIIYKNSSEDSLPGIANTHGNRVFLGYHFNGIYANDENGGALPSPASSWFTPEKHLTLKGKELFDQALVYAATNCIDEICDDGIDNDQDGLTDCADPECIQTNFNPGIVSGDEISCSAFTAGPILSYEDPYFADGTFTNHWQMSTDSINWTTISGENGLTYTPGNISSTTYFRRLTINDLCGSELYSNIIAKIVDNTLPICIEEEGFDFDCEIGYKISPSGSGIKGVANPAVRVLNPTFMEYYIVEATFSGGVGAAEQVIFNTLEGEQRVVTKQYYEGESGTAGNRFFRTILPPSDSIFLSYNGDSSLAESFVVYTVATMDNFSSASKGFESFGKSVHKELLPNEEYKVSFPLTTTINHKEAYVNVSLSGIENDGTEIYISAFGDGASQTDTIYEPNKGNTLHLEFTNVEEILPDADSIHIVIKSPASNGQTALISGYVAAIVECDQNLVITAETDVECIAVGDTIVYDYTVYNFADVEFQNLNANSSLGGSIDFGASVIAANSQLSTSQDIVITQEMIDNPPVVNNVFVSGFNFAFGIKPKSDGITDTLVICEICDDGIDNDEDGLTDCLDPDCNDDGETAGLTSNQEICEGESVDIIASGGASYAWSHGLGTGSTKTVSPASTTTYFVTITNTNGCDEILNSTVTVNQAAIVEVTGPVELCIGSTSTLTPTTGGVWSSSDADVAEVTNEGIVTAVGPGTATFTFTTNANCISAPSEEILVDNKGKITIEGDPILCVGETSNFTASKGGGSWISSNPSVATINSSGVVTAISAGNVIITYDHNSKSCPQDPTFGVVVNEDPVVTIIGATEICVGENTQLSSSVSGGFWTSSDSNIAIVSSTGIVVGISAGTVTFTYTNENGCESSVSGTITVHPEVNVNIDFNGSLCLEDDSQLSAIATGGTAAYTYSWTGPNGFSSSLETVSIVDDGNYNLTVTDSKGCSSNTTAFVYASYQPFIFTLNTEVCEGEDVTLSVTETQKQPTNGVQMRIILRLQVLLLHQVILPLLIQLQ